MSYREDFWVTFNGEIYNYKELRGDLEAVGYHFSSGSDTEVLLAAYAESGRDTAHNLYDLGTREVLGEDLQVL